MCRTLGIVITFFVAIELMVRFSIPEIQPLGNDSGLVKDSVYGAFPALKPKAQGKSMGMWFKVNEEGFWDYGTKQSNYTTLYLGDSVTMGVGVKPHLTFAGLGSQKVLNPSWLGYNYQVYPQVIYKVLQRHKINSVYLFWCLNDIQPLNKHHSISRKSSKNISYFLNNYYFTFQWLKKQIGNRAKIHYQQDAMLYTSKSVHFQQSIKNLIYIQDLCKRHKIDFNIIILPYAYQMQTHDFSPQQKIVRALKKQNIRVSWLSGFQEEDYLYGDGIHFSAKGHQKIAEKIIK